MNRRLVIVAALVLIGAGVALFLAMSGDSDKHAKSGDAPAAQNSSPDRSAPQPTRGQPTRSTKPADPNADDRPPTVSQLEDGTIVRDHRDPGAAPYVRPNLPRPEDSPIKPMITSSVMQQVRPIVIGCMASVPDSAFGDPRNSIVETRASVSIDASGNLTVLELGPAVSGIDEAASAEAMECIRKAAGDIHVHVDSQPVPQATLAFAIRPMYYRKHAQ